MTSDPQPAVTTELELVRRGAVLILRLNRPEARNSLTDSMIRGIGAAVLAAEADPEVRVLVLTGTGDRAFCAGLDLRAFAGGTSFDAGNEGYADFDRLTRGAVSLPVVGAANGSAFGGGLELLLGADIIVAAPDAIFGFPEVKRGLFPAGGGTDIGSRVPLSIALELTLTGDPITAARGREIGLINTVVPAAQVLPAALEFAERIAANSPLGLAATKELVRLGATGGARAAERLRQWQTTVFASADAKEGAQAFLEKRTPVWRGR
jgi:enoyl-CoA hydratase/carnithine racemase